MPLNLASKLPIDPSSDELFQKFHDGILLARLIEHVVPGTLDSLAPKSLHHRSKLTDSQKRENLALAIECARRIGLRVGNVLPDDLASANRTVILSLLFQLIRVGLAIDLTALPSVIYFFEKRESLEEFEKVSPEAVVARWVNHHLEGARSPRRLKDFAEDLMVSSFGLILVISYFRQGLMRVGVERWSQTWGGLALDINQHIRY